MALPCAAGCSARAKSLLVRGRCWTARRRFVIVLCELTTSYGFAGKSRREEQEGRSLCERSLV